MKKTALLLVITAMLLPMGGDVRGDESRTLKGEYVWTQRDATDPIEAVFTQTGEAQWDVAFHFKFRDEPHTYKGQAHGSLTDGALEGEVRNENEKRSFTFQGTFEDGVFNGTHRETTKGRERDTGTIMLNG